MTMRIPRPPRPVLLLLLSSAALALARAPEARAQHEGHKGHEHGHAAPALDNVTYIDVDKIRLDDWISKDCQLETAGASTAGATAATPAALSATLVTGEAREIAPQREKQRFVNSYEVGAMGKRKSERWFPEPPGGMDRGGMFEVSIYPCQASLTSEQKAAALELVQKSFRAAQKHGWFDFTAAEAQGFHRMTGGDEYHFVNQANVKDGRILAPDAPEFLMYYQVGGKPTLTGIMYLMPEIGDRGPQIGGPLTLWHYHIMDKACYRDGIIVGLPDGSGRCAEGKASERTPEMLHVWFVPRHDGPFATDMIPPG